MKPGHRSREQRRLTDIIDFQEERRALRTPPCPATEIPCSECGRFLIKDEFVLGFRLMCDNHECPLFREGQGIISRETRGTHRRPSRVAFPGYQEEISRRKKYYHELREVGFCAMFARRFTSNKQMKRIRKLIKRGLSPDFIAANLQ
jgi:hypothetical protein